MRVPPRVWEVTNAFDDQNDGVLFLTAAIISDTNVEKVKGGPQCPCYHLGVYFEGLSKRQYLGIGISHVKLFSTSNFSTLVDLFAMDNLTIDQMTSVSYVLYEVLMLLRLL